MKHHTTTGKWTGADYEVFDKYISFIKSVMCYVMEPIVCCLVKNGGGGWAEKDLKSLSFPVDYSSTFFLFSFLLLFVVFKVF